ncbi:hypothetical protein LOZ66_004845 [Ophidiomyces ophidiicola]|nr:hypothetical protein LOZ66_004845 [Ophidiomyces ophidiicola]
MQPFPSAILSGAGASPIPSSLSKPVPIQTRYSTMAPEERDLFTYTSGRYLYNEKLRLIERHVEFNVRALKSIATRSVGRESVTGITKLTEGGFKRIFLLTMNDGFEAIVKIPYLHTVPKMFTTESEVAT